MQSAASGAHVFICRAGYERTLSQEWSLFHPEIPQTARGGPAEEATPGWIAVSGAHSLPERAFIFERQRLPQARWWAGHDLTAISTPIAEVIATSVGNADVWTLHSFAPNPDTEDSRTREAQALERRVLGHLEAHAPEVLTRLHPAERGPAPGSATVWQLCQVAGGVWSSEALQRELSDPYPGGIHRMPQDTLAPSRSYLKVEEALDVMRQSGLGGSPRPDETAVDLGAAPGGWTWALVKRGCRVYAVDNGPLKLQSQGDMGGEAIHLREDGLRFRPQDHVRGPVDWLLSDMLIAPGQVLGLLRKWLDGGWARNLVVNIKLPQADPLVALNPIVDYLRSVPGLRFQLRQLYHDRREVTLVGRLEGGPAKTMPATKQGAPGKGRPQGKPRRGPAPAPKGRRQR